MGSHYHSYGTSLAIWDHTVLPAIRHNAHDHTYKNSLSKFKIPWVFQSYPELKNFQVFQSCKHPATSLNSYGGQSMVLVKFSKFPDFSLTFCRYFPRRD